MIWKVGRHSKAPSALIQADEAEDGMSKLREKTRSYARRDCYNMDEATLFYGLTPEWTLATGAELEKREETRLTVTLCCNADGSDKLDPWFVGKAKSPRALGGEDNTAIANLPCVYRGNGKAWMTYAIMVEWLRWFDAKMAGRRVLLLLDSFSAHEKTVQLLLEEQGGLQNTAVEFFLPDDPPFYQPCTNGITANWKLLYRQYWLEFMVRLSLLNQDPIREMNIHYALRWGCQAWKDDLQKQSIYNCWTHSTVFWEYFGPQPEGLDYSHIESLAMALQNMGVIRPAKNLTRFVNPTDEEVIDVDPANLIEHIVTLFAPEDPAGALLPIPSHQQAISALETLIRYECSQKKTVYKNYVKPLEGYLSRVSRRVTEDTLSRARQTLIHHYFN
ncbi:DDE-domain-containing protein [Pleomassaria siparia CBS 279.74]|uniref:DDE-domain-containing protein n=1 Tax=Pleomassaria siparia CBS 279.74 TaxID=1314801 RepID=A0A6G1JPA8_9PLEO|nr:DDE-domain-containing protein [Pleomassaria siparia CBS 279.74]